MRPQWSILIFTTLAGAAQGLLLALFALECAWPGLWTPAVLAAAAWVALALLAAGLAASVFHLGRPARAWRAASQWRTSWLSREVIVLPALMGAVALHALALGSAGAGGPEGALARASGVAAVALALLLWWCTGMIYACLRMLQEWATPLTPLVFGALGAASGCGLAAAGFACLAPWPADAAAGADAVRALALAAAGLTVLAAVLKALWWRRRQRLVPRSTLQSALAIGHPVIRQIAMGMTGGSFNTREFFHGQRDALLRALPVLMVAGGAVLPLAGYLIAARHPGSRDAACLLCGAVAVQLVGVLVERWLFFAWARHPQNLYYQRVS